VVFSRVASLDGLFLMQPLKTNYNPQPTKLLKQEWIFQKEIKLATLEHLKKFGNFPAEIDLLSFCSFMAGQDNTDQFTISRETAQNKANVQKKRIKKRVENTSMDYLHFDRWLSTKNMQRIIHETPQYGNCLFESISKALPTWRGKPLELRFKSLKWAQSQISEGTTWGKTMWTNFEITKANPDSYSKNSYSEYISFLMDPKVYGTEYDIVMLCQFLNISIDVYSLSNGNFQNGELSYIVTT
jgi:hypothetical protein